jgi:hypothetical protein
MKIAQECPQASSGENFLISESMAKMEKALLKTVEWFTFL